MLKVVFRRLWGNKWKAMAMFLGLVLAIASAFCIPVYADGILQRVVIKNFEESYTDTGVYPGYVVFNAALFTREKNAAAVYSSIESVLDRTSEDYIGLPVLKESRICKFNMFAVLTNEAEQTYLRPTVYSIENLENEVTVTLGRMYNPERSDGVIEVVVSHEFIVKQSLIMNQMYTLESSLSGEADPVLFEIVGIIEPADASDSFWYKQFSKYNVALFIPDGAFDEKMASDSLFTRHFSEIFYIKILDYTKIDNTLVNDMIEGYEREAEDVSAIVSNGSLEFSGLDALNDYVENYSGISVNLFMLLIPLFILLAFYIIIAAKIKTDSEVNEISVMQSRGASRGFILCLYLIESFFMTVGAVAAGLPLGMFFCRVIGASNGFLEFVNRTALSLRVVSEALYAAGLTAVLFLVISMLPAFFSAGVTIVESKRRGTKKKHPFYHKYFLDILFLGLSLYGFYTMRLSQSGIGYASETASEATLQNTNFLLYLSATLFALGAGMLFLRLYPLILKLIFRLGRKIWPAPVYSALSHSSRTRDFSNIMLFIILTLSIGIFSADAARTLNTNISNNVYCVIGADALYTPIWTMYTADGSVVHGTPDANGGTITITDTDDGSSQVIPIYYKELTVDIFENVDEVENAARLYIHGTKVKLRFPGKSGYVPGTTIMCISPYEFANTAWNVSDMNDYHLNEYINVMTEYPEGCLMNRAIMEAYVLEPGDTVRITDTNTALDFVIIAAIDTWPGYEPTIENSEGELIDNPIIIVNWDYFFESNPIRPYSFLIEKAEGVADEELFNALLGSEFGMSAATFSGVEIAKEKNDPILQGTNGLLSVSFIISAVICAAGVMVYWIISIKKRTLQFGISRALGMGKAGITATLLLEQLLVSGIAVLFGMLIGEMGSRMFVPVLANTYKLNIEVLPFKVVALEEDFVRVSIIMAFVLTVCSAVLIGIVSGLKADRALKLGEE